MKKTLIFALLAIAFSAHAASGEIPVYPGAKLDMDKQRECCNFTTKDPFEKVLAFYEAHFKTKPLTSKAFAERFPAWRANMLQLEKQAPPGFKIMFFVTSETVAGGSIYLMVTSFGGVTRFSLNDEDLGKSGAGWAQEFRKRSGKAGAGMDTGANELDAAYEGWFREHPAVKASDAGLYNLPLYKNGYISTEYYKSKNCYRVWVITPDPFEKVAAFYEAGTKGRLLPGTGNSEPDAPLRFGDVRFEVEQEAGGPDPSPGYVKGKRGDMNLYVTLRRPGDGSDGEIPSRPYFDSGSRGYVKGAPVQGVVVELQSEVLEGSCVEIPQKAKWLKEPPSQNEFVR